MQVAIFNTTGSQVEILSVSGGWSTVREIGHSKSFKVRNGSLSKPTTIEAEIVRRYHKAPAEAKKPRARKPIEQRKNGKIDPLYLPGYVEYKTVRANGTLVRSLDKGDSLAVLWRAQTLKDVYKSAAALLGVSASDLVSRFAHLNPGMQRMSLGNMVRKVMKNG